jgi:hypothetical protein
MNEKKMTNSLYSTQVVSYSSDKTLKKGGKRHVVLKKGEQKKRKERKEESK